MILKVYAVQDTAVEAFMSPFCMRADGEASRAFMNLVRQKGTEVNNFPANFSLFRLGTYDDSIGQFKNELAPVLLMTGANAQGMVEARSVFARSDDDVQS